MQDRSPVEPSLTTYRSTSRLVPLIRAGNGTRTRDPNLGKVVLYQLSYSRTILELGSRQPVQLHTTIFRHASRQSSEHCIDAASCVLLPRHGGEGNRTPDLLNAIQALSQLSYAPACSPLHNERSDGSRQEPRRIAEGISSVKKLGLAKI